MHAVLHRLRLRDDLEPDPRPDTLWVDDRVRSVVVSRQLIVGHADLAPILVPGAVTAWRRFHDVAERLAPERHQQPRLRAVDRDPQRHLRRAPSVAGPPKAPPAGAARGAARAGPRDHRHRRTAHPPAARPPTSAAAG